MYRHTMVYLVIVESPAKCSKIQGFLGDGYIVQATMGHIRALEESLDSVGIDKDWTPIYRELPTKKEAITKLKKSARGADVILATDDDREGEGIAWHICHILKLNPATTPRIVFHEITKPAILSAVASPRRIDLNKFHAQQARAMLDLLVGFTMSRVLWNRVAPKLSAGRCQTPALRLVVERDVEVEHHTSASFWKIQGVFQHSTLPTIDASANDTFETGEEAYGKLEKVVHNPNARLVGVKTSVRTNNPPQPFITSTLQQEASNTHGLSPKITMQVAQKLYEAGHITYMRTDNPVLSDEIVEHIRNIIVEKHGPAFLGQGQGQGREEDVGSGSGSKKGKKKKATTKATEPVAQAAHEAIRPTHPEIEHPDISDPTQKTIYKLIWRRTMESLMAPCLTDVRKLTIELEADPSLVMTTEQTHVQFPGWRIYERSGSEDDTVWNAWFTATIGTPLQWKTLTADENFTKPKGRYTEASLIAELEKRGIGRPSTFASLVSTILDRTYVEKTNVEGTIQDSKHYTITPFVFPPVLKIEKHKTGAEKNKLRSTHLGRSVSDFLHREYHDVFNYEFTASMESKLDEIANHAKPWKSLLQETWDTYKDRYFVATSGSGGSVSSERERVLDTGIKVILSRKGPLFVKDPPTGSAKSVKATFAPLPTSVSFETATLEDALQAFAVAEETKSGELLGTYNGSEMRKKKGPYGFYIEWNSIRIPFKDDMTLEQIQEKLQLKQDSLGSAYCRVVGDYTIKKGPYGLYFYKHTLKKVKFMKFPVGGDPDAISAKDLQELASALATKKPLRS